MTLADAVVWGGLGSLAAIGLEFWSDMRRTKGTLLKKHRRIGYWIGEGMRIIVGCIIAAALADAQQINGRLGALTAGIAAPLIVARLGREIPRLGP
jgi:undecaprenyl pyrophosphate phosphatase UppP